MTSLPRDDSERFGLSVGVGVFLSLISGLSALWFSRSYYFNSDRVGWGDRSADRAQSLFWWGAVISIAVLLLMALIISTRSKRFRFAVGGAGTLSGILMLVSQRPGLRCVSWPLLPGVFATMMAFGVHSDFRKWSSILWVFGINTLFYSAIIGGAFTLLNWRKRLRGKVGLGARG